MERPESTIARPDPILLGGHLALDFLNSIATPVDTPVEWLDNGAGLIDWLVKSGALREEQLGECRHRYSPKALDGIATEARAFREWLRAELKKRLGPSSSRMTEKELRPLNELLAEGRTYRQVDGGPPPQLINVRPLLDPRQLLQPLAEAAADLLCNVDLNLVRACEGKVCTLMFLDATKSHHRRWCSMALCGNRAKVAAFRDRKRG